MGNNKRTVSAAVGLLLWLLLASCTPAAADNAPRSDLPLETCQLSAPGVALRVEARCGTLQVPENWAEPGGRQLMLRVAVVASTGKEKERDPLLFLTGGPGQAATESYPPLDAAFGRARRTRDVVLVDQRGTGQSNPLRCPALAAAQTLEAGIAQCLAELDADPRFYTTEASVADLEAVRRALGYEQWNVYGLSYGTRLALEYARRHPQALRAMVLDGIVPPGLPLGRDVGRDAQRALELIWARCEGQPSCQAAFPTLRAEWDALLAALDEQPQTLTVEHPATGAPTPVTMDRAALATTVRLLSYAPETAALLPLMVHHAQATGDLSKLAAQFLIVTSDLGSTISEGLNASVLCAEDVPFFTEAEAAAASEGSYLGTLQSDQLLAVCRLWPHGEQPAEARQPVQAEVPTLLFSGEVDPVTPPAYGEAVAAMLPNARHLVAPGQGHNVVLRACFPRLLDDFLNTLDAEGLNSVCTSAIVPPPFFVDFTGP